ncbi:MAG: histone deacetylase [Acidobacteriota bacterium]
MLAFYCDHFVLPLPDGHRFPMIKYRRLRERVTTELPTVRSAVPEAATDDALIRVHDADYVRRVVDGSLERADVRRIGFPWSPALVERSRRSVGGTVAACRAALTDGVAVNLAGGTHHAFADRGGGFCVFNDAAVASRAMQADHGVSRVLIVDLDVHQGDGTAAIFAEDPSVFTLSLHGRRNYPFRKQTSDLDVPLDDGTDDRAYLDALDAALDRALPVAGPDLVIYLAGADPYVGDRLGKLAVTAEGLAERDRRVFARCRREGVPVAVVMAGGYAPDVEAIVSIHTETVRQAAALWTRATLAQAAGSD